MKLEIEGRVALVVGASRGIGFAIADTLAAEGAKVAMAARGLDGIKAAAGKIGRGTSCHAADVTNPAAALSLMNEIEKQWGTIDILVCNVGSGTSVPPGKETAAEWSRVMDINLFATTNTIEAARPLMNRGQGDRAIVCVSSICGLAALGAPVTYSAPMAPGRARSRKTSLLSTRCSCAKCQCGDSASPKKLPTSSPSSPLPARRSSRAP
jgi:3-oxoacyl-[acyl-carrier protein] reductase